MFDKQMFAKRLKELREENKLNQKEFAKEIGISSGSISYYEKAERLPDIEVISLIADRFKVSTDYLIGISSFKSPDMEPQAICKYTGLSEQSLERIKGTMSFAKCIDELALRKDDANECCSILSDEKITNKDNVNLINKEYKQISLKVTEENICNTLFSVLYSQMRFIDTFRDAILKKIKYDIVSTVLKYDIEEAKKSYSEKFKYNSEYDYEKGINLLHLIYALDEEYRFVKWQLSEELNKFSETIIKEVLGENNADD